MGDKEKKMEAFSGFHKEDDEQMVLPPGFRFHPTDEELITHYLHNKVLNIDFSAKAIGEVDLNKAEPWELPCRFKRTKSFFNISALNIIVLEILMCVGLMFLVFFLVNR